MYSPRAMYRFMKSVDFRNALNTPFYKRHMESIDIKSPFDSAEEIFLFEYLIKSGYVIASYRNDDNNDTEIYLLSTLGHAFMERYSKSFRFRLRMDIYYYHVIYVVILASTVGSLIAGLIFERFIRQFL